MNEPFIPRVLQVLPALRSGGVEQVTVDTVRLLCGHYKVPETFVASAGGALVEKVVNSGANHLSMPLNRKDPWALWKNAQLLKKLITEKNIQLVHARSRGPAWSALWAAKTLGIPFITTYHGTYNNTNKLKSFYNSVMVRGNYVIAISQFIARYIQEHHAHLKPNVVVIPEGIDTDFFNPTRVSKEEIAELRQQWQIPSDKKLILLPGRLTRWKGQDVLLRALRHMDTGNLYIVLLGDDQGRLEFRQELEVLAQGYPVKFVTSAENMPVAYKAADVVLSCSTEPEAFGRVTAEALAMGRMVIGVGHGATPEQCMPGKTGFLVSSNAPHELAAVLKEVLALPEEKKLEIGERAHEHIGRHFSLSRMIEQTVDLYQEAILR